MSEFGRNLFVSLFVELLVVMLAIIFKEKNDG